MKPELIGENVRANCPDCEGARSNFESRYGGQEYGLYQLSIPEFTTDVLTYNLVVYRLLKCTGCGKGGISRVFMFQGKNYRLLDDFYPLSIEHQKLPDKTALDILSEFKEAEKCLSIGAYRAARHYSDLL